jgi:hypothetical protein
MTGVEGKNGGNQKFALPSRWVTDQDITGVVLLRERRANGEYRENVDSKFGLLGIRHEAENPENPLLLAKTGVKMKKANS